LESGGAYVPLDPSHASQRLRDILRDAAPVCLVADESGLAALGETVTKVATLVDLNPSSTFHRSLPILGVHLGTATRPFYLTEYTVASYSSIWH
jgi:non-ribosomal peptide synthetase component F